MDIEHNGLEMSVNLDTQSDKWLVKTAQELSDVAQNRGLKLSFATGVTAVEGAKQNTKDEYRIETSTPSTKEFVTDQFINAYNTYTFVINTINSSRNNNDLIYPDKQKRFKSELNEWFTYEKQRYIENAMDNDPKLRFTLIAIPNIIVTANELLDIAKDFGKNQPKQTVYEDTILESLVPEDISGTHPSNGKTIQFCLIPSKDSPELIAGTVSEQKYHIDELQSVTPALKVPSLLDTITYWYALRGQGYDLIGDHIFDRTYVRHFDLPEHSSNELSMTRETFIDIDGAPCIFYSTAQVSIPGRLAIG
ncbi:MAG: hypothetical protein NVSMB46_01840 [Candidatus Saccharimonadales bacterium]